MRPSSACIPNPIFNDLEMQRKIETGFIDCPETARSCIPDQDILPTFATDATRGTGDQAARTDIVSDDWIEAGDINTPASQRIQVPVPRDHIFRSRVLSKRIWNLAGPMRIFTMKSESGSIAMTAWESRRSKSSYFALTAADGSYLGKLRADLIGSEYVLYSPGRAPGADPGVLVRSDLLAIRYRNTLLRFKGKKSPRKVFVAFHSVVHPALEAEPGYLIDALRKKEGQYGIDILENRPPVFDETKQTYKVEFPSTRASLSPSVKNMVLPVPQPGEGIALSFARIDRDTYALDFGSPLSPLQAFAIAVSSIDFKICCD